MAKQNQITFGRTSLKLAEARVLMGQMKQACDDESF